MVFNNSVLICYGNGEGGTTKTGSSFSFAVSFQNTQYKLVFGLKNTHTALFTNAAALCIKTRNCTSSGFYCSGCYSAKEAISYSPYDFSYIAIGI